MGPIMNHLGNHCPPPRLDFLNTKGPKGTLKIGGYPKLVPRLSRTTCRLFQEVLFPGKKVPMCRKLVTTPELGLLPAGGEVDFSQTEEGPLAP